jgi:hypothetical protein
MSLPVVGDADHWHPAKKFSWLNGLVCLCHVPLLFVLPDIGAYLLKAILEQNGNEDEQMK